jgi:hypothetical protein
MDMAKWLDGLVRVVAKDGSVWWVPPASAARYAALDSAFVVVKK